MAQWWDEWQLRIVVLASLCAQYFLVLVAGVRKFHIPPWLRFLFRLAHIGSDALAIFALAMLFNRQKGGPRCSYSPGSRDLELLWAPILVMHLGGQVVITSYKIEDNEQWSRHILTSLSKVTVALYVFYKSWSSDDKRLLVATILFFILVVIRCLQKALDLKSSSFNALRKASPSEIQWSVERSDDEDTESVVRSPNSLDTSRPSLRYKLFLDISSNSSDRVKIMKLFCKLDPESAYREIEGILSSMTSFLYTKDDRTPYLAFKNAPKQLIFRRSTQAVAYATLITAICLVHTSSHKEAYSGEDTRVTLVLLYGSLLLELVYFCVQLAFRDTFSGRITQHSLLGSLQHNTWQPRLRRIAGWLQCKELVDQYFAHMEPSDLCEEITELILCHVMRLWKERIVDTESYRGSNDTRGGWSLEGWNKEFTWSVGTPFDESVIIWHLATYLCFNELASSDDDPCVRRCKVMSNYMMHLLFENPEMLMPGSRKNLYAEAYDELEVLLGRDKILRLEAKRQITTKVVDDASSSSARFVLNARIVATDLLDLKAGTIRMWEVIEGVWMEMLCFSAGWSRGYSHAETLGTGVEYLSYVWVLLAYAGMEIFPDKLQRTIPGSLGNYSIELREVKEAATVFLAKVKATRMSVLEV